MVIFHYDKTFEGLLSAVFDAYFRKTFPDKLLGLEEIDPLFVDENYTVVTQKDKAERVWKALKKKLSSNACNMLTYVWLSELEESDRLIFQYIRKVFDSEVSIELNLIDDDILQVRNLAQKVNKERLRMIEFVRFQKAADDIFFAPISPDYNCLPLIIQHFKARFADQKWIIYDIKRDYGFYYDLKTVTEMTLETTSLFPGGKLNEALMAEDEKKFQQLWKAYFKSTTIKDRINPKLHCQLLPRRYWKYMTEKQ
ncbi:TIGR03915 family putative DNA repair protein [Microbacter margulisiae]|uniref:Putative DNA metabolism protein n=1 Tax=Microbacter margulisiae TaxID=1350067 RepID=A0A7W5H1V0_9PORP|nr:TIGR03915 family putative DNA repair protein [Microbacter margulisiae]MBB3186756.1 putative DNA metabolism protein [Microbacter margulisiae]